MKKCLVSFFVGCLVAGCIGTAVAASSTQPINAEVNYGISVKYNNVAQNFTNAGGSPVYPIVYEGTTYLPVRAVANMLGLPVDWDQATQTVYLGEKEKTPVTGDMCKKYSMSYHDVAVTSDKSELVVDGQAYNFGIVAKRQNLPVSDSVIATIKSTGHSKLVVKAVCRNGESGTLSFRDGPYSDSNVYKQANLANNESQIIEVDIGNAENVYLWWSARNAGNTVVITDMYLK